MVKDSLDKTVDNYDTIQAEPHIHLTRMSAGGRNVAGHGEEQVYKSIGRTVMCHTKLT